MTEKTNEHGLTETEQKYFETGDESLLGGGEPQAEGAASVEGADAAKTDPTAATKTDEGKSDGAKGEPAAESKTVPHAALHEARLENKQLKADLAQLRDEITQLKAGLQKPADAAKDQAPADPEPDKALEPQAWNEWKIRQLEKQLGEVGGTVKADKEQAAKDQKMQAFIGGYRSQMNAYVQTNPDYVEVHNWLMQHRQQELMQVYGLSEDQAKQAAIADELYIADIAMKQGTNPAERFRKIAEMRGYKPGGGQAAAAQPGAQKKTEMEMAGRAAATSLSQAGGSATPNSTVAALANKTPEELAAMSDEEFRKHFGEAA
jgi:hypothetical protein